MNMKKTGRKVAGILAFALLVLSLSFTGCSHGSELETYEVTFEVNGGSAVQAQTVVEDSLVAEPKDPAKDGFTFGGWFTDAECTTAFDFTAKIEEDLTLYAKWNEVEKAEDKPEEEQEEDAEAEVNKEYNIVSFDVAGGSYVASQKLDKGAKASKPSDPKKEGYTFGGWLLNDKEYDFNLVVPSNLTLTAKWTKNTYTVTFDKDCGLSASGNTIKAQKVAFEEKATLPERPFREDDLTFAGWYEDPLYENEFDFDTLITEDITIYAKWDVPSSTGKVLVRFITFTFDENNDVVATEAASSLVESGSSATEPAAVTKKGYTFDGWYFDSDYSASHKYDFTSTIYNAKNLYARWRKNPSLAVTVASDLQLEVKYNSDYTISIKEKNGTYGTWYIDGSLYSNSSNMTVNSVNYSKGTHVVMFKYSSGSYYYSVSTQIEIQ